MTPADARIGVPLTAAALLLILGPPTIVALAGAGVPLWVGGPILVVLAIGLGRTGRLPPLPVHLIRRHPLLAAVWLLAFAAATAQVARASVFAYDVSARSYSVVPNDQFRSQHNCLTAYVEAARFTAAGQDAYDPAAYRPGGVPRRFGPLTVDPFHYPPPFLLLPSAVRTVAPEFFAARRVWYGLQILLLAATVAALVRWVGSDPGWRLALAAVAIWALPNIHMGLQTGNFQITAVCLGLLGMVLAVRGHRWPGGGLIAFAAAGKVFPSMLVLYLIAARRWRSVAAVAVTGAGLAALTALLFGVGPFVHFLRDELPRLASGASFPQTELLNTIPVNQSIYGFTVKLRELGAAALDAPTGKRIAQVYAALLAALVVFAGWRAGRGHGGVEPEGRLRLAVQWLAILNLASFASPFVGGSYGSMGTTLLLVLLLAGARTPREGVLWAGALVVLSLFPYLTPSPSAETPPGAWALGLSAAWQVVVVALNVWAAWPAAARRSEVAASPQAAA